MALHDAPTCTMLKRLSAGPILCESPELTESDHALLVELRKAKLAQVDRSKGAPVHRITKHGQQWLTLYTRGLRKYQNHMKQVEFDRRR